MTSAAVSVCESNRTRGSLGLAAFAERPVTYPASVARNRRSSSSMLRVLSLLEARVLGVLVEKERTVPDSYPLTLNALVAGCNQKSSRDPVLNAAETDVQAAVDGLKSMLLAIERSGGRVARYAHNVERMMNVPQQAAALLAVLMLRGPQTAGELRINCERLHCFADIPEVEALLNELAERPEGALVAELPRQPGSRENRWMHLLSGAPPVPSSSEVDLSAESPSPGISELAAVKANVARLEAELREVKDLLAKVCAQLGIE